MSNNEFWDNEDFGDGDDDLFHAYLDLKEGKISRLLDENEFEIIIDIFIQTNEEAEAIEACDTGLTYHPYSSVLLLKKAEVFFIARKYGQALQSLNQAETLSGRTVESVLLRSDIYMAQDRVEQSVVLLKTSIPEFDEKDKIDLMLELSDIYDEQGSFDEVFEILEEILKMEPQNEEALHKISFWADITRKQENSVLIHEKIIEEDPFNALAWFNLGAAYQGLKKYEKAVDAYEYCIAIDEKFEVAYRNMADACMKLHWYEKAIESLEKNLELGQPEDIIYEAMGHCFERKKDYGKARHFYHEALKLNPADDLVFHKIGETYMKEKNWEKAVNSFATSISLNGNNALSHLALGNCYLELEEYVNAIDSFLKALELKPNNLSSWTTLFKGFYKSGLYAEILENTIHAINTIGNRVDFYFYEAMALFALGKSKEAMIKLEDGISEAPQKIKIIMEIAPELLQRARVTELISRYKKQNK